MPVKEAIELFSISQNDDRVLNINSTNLEKLNVGNNLKLINIYKFSKVFEKKTKPKKKYLKPQVNL